jgi:hypothetical protein
MPALASSVEPPPGPPPSECDNKIGVAHGACVSNWASGLQKYTGAITSALCSLNGHFVNKGACVSLIQSHKNSHH